MTTQARVDRYTTTNNNNEYLERLTRTGPKRLHVLCKYTLSKFNAYNKNVGFEIAGSRSLPFSGREWEWEVRVNSAGKFVCVFLSLNKV